MTSEPLSEKFPINSVLEVTLKGQKDPVKGVVYCTDEVSRTLVLKKALVHTTLASEVMLISADSVTNQKVIEKEAGEAERVSIGAVSKKTIEAQEKKAIRLAEEALQHINQKASPEGQAVFDRLLKACNEVVWKEASIQVLNQIQVDPPYSVNDCRLISDAGRQAEGSLERVKKIVGHSS